MVRGHFHEQHFVAHLLKGRVYIVLEASHHALGQGIIGTFVGIGASFSATLAGYMTDHLGSAAAFAGLAAIAAAGFVVVWYLMPETREPQENELRGRYLPYRP